MDHWEAIPFPAKWYMYACVHVCTYMGEHEFIKLAVSWYVYGMCVYMFICAHICVEAICVFLYHFPIIFFWARGSH